MINVNLTNEQFAMLHRLVRDGREHESRLAYNSRWPENGHHEANVRLIDSIDDTLRMSLDFRIRMIRQTEATT